MLSIWLDIACVAMRESYKQYGTWYVGSNTTAQVCSYARPICLGHPSLAEAVPASRGDAKLGRLLRVGRGETAQKRARRPRRGEPAR